MDKPKLVTLVRAESQRSMTGGWYSFELATEEVERRLGMSRGAAQKLLVELCESGALRWQNRPMGGPDISCNDLKRRLEKRLERKPGGKQALIIAQLEKMFPNGVPDAKLCPRKTLKGELLKKDAALAPLDEATLRTAIITYNGTKSE